MVHCISLEASMRVKRLCVLITTQPRAKFCASKPPVAKAALRSRAVVLALFIYCLMHFRLFVGVQCLSLFCYASICIISSFAITLKKKRIGWFAFIVLWMSCYCKRLFLAVLWIDLQCVIVVFPDHTYLLFLATLLCFSSRYIVSVIVLWLLLNGPWVCLQYVIVVFPDPTHLLFSSSKTDEHNWLHERYVIDRPWCHMAVEFGVFVNEDHDKLSTFYWLPKFHNKHINHVLLQILVRVLLMSCLYSKRCYQIL